MNFLFLTTLLVLLFSLISTSMTTSLKTTSVAYHLLKEVADTKLDLENKIATSKYVKKRKNKTEEEILEEIQKNKEERKKKKFIFRSTNHGPNSKLNLYPLLISSYTNAQKKEIKETFIRLLVILYKKEIPTIKHFAAKLLQELERTKYLSKVFSKDQEKREIFLSLCKRSKHSLLNYVTVQEHEKVQAICINGLSKQLLLAFVGEEAKNNIYQMEKKHYYSGEDRETIPQKKYAELITLVQASMIRTDLRNKKHHNQEMKVTKNGEIIINGAPLSLSYISEDKDAW